MAKPEPPTKADVAKEDVHPLLLALDAYVRRDGAPPGMGGKVCIGVNQGEDTVWWQAVLAQNAATALVATPDPDVSCALLISRSVADDLYDGEEVGLDDAWVYGDRSLLKGVLARYLQKTSSVSVRFAQV